LTMAKLDARHNSEAHTHTHTHTSNVKINKH
jgi:hypothetical protein